MKRVSGHILAGLTVLAVGVSVTSACVHDNSTIFVFDVLAPQEVSNGQICLFTTDTTQPYLSSGVADVDFIDSYTPFFLVGNQMVPQENPATPQDETSYVTIQGAIVRITDSGGNQLTSFTRLTSGILAPLSGQTPSFTPISVLIIDPGTLNRADVRSVVNSGGVVRLVTYTRFFGQTTGGDNVESDDFEFPVDVCRGCLIQFAPQNELADYEAPNCGAALSGGTQTLPIPCVPGQDIPIACSQCLNVPDCNPPLVHIGPQIVDGGPG